MIIKKKESNIPITYTIISLPLLNIKLSDIDFFFNPVEFQMAVLNCIILILILKMIIPCIAFCACNDKCFSLQVESDN